MITLRFTASRLDAELLAQEQFPALECKSISAAWNEIRKMRDTYDRDTIEGAILEVTLPEGETSDRIPHLIQFKTNAKGKMEFKDYDKLQARAAKNEQKAQEKAAAKAEAKKASKPTSDAREISKALGKILFG
jgi:hypothetical protein